MRKYAGSRADRVWAVQASNGAGRSLAQRFLEDGEDVVDVPAKLAARVRLFDIGHDRKTDAHDAHAAADPVVAARTLADVGDVTRFADRNRFASGTGTAPLDASSGEQNRYRLSRAGNRRMNHMIHIAAISQIRLHRGPGLLPTQARRGKEVPRSDQVSQPQVSDAITTSSSKTPSALPSRTSERVREGTAGRLKNPARSTFPYTSTLRISHFPDPRARRYARHRRLGRPSWRTPSKPLVDNRRDR